MGPFHTYLFPYCKFWYIYSFICIYHRRANTKIIWTASQYQSDCSEQFPPQITLFDSAISHIERFHGPPSRRRHSFKEYRCRHQRLPHDTSLTISTRSFFRRARPSTSRGARLSPHPLHPTSAQRCSRFPSPGAEVRGCLDICFA